MSPVEDYALGLDGLRLLAQRDFLNWWKQTEHLEFLDRKKALEEPWAAIVGAYGEQAAHLAADYLFLQRSLDESLRELEYPEVADPVGFDQAVSAYRAGMWVEDPRAVSVGVLDARKTALSGILNRLAVDPARKTVEINVAKAGTRYARVPEPGACSWCLMLASRGAAYVGSQSAFGEMGRYHDNCRCLAIEAKSEAALPRINKDLLKTRATLDRELGHPAGVNDWRQFVTARRQQAGMDVEWPRLQYAKIPHYIGDGKSTVFPGEDLPSLAKMPGHVLHGWTDKGKGGRSGWPHTEDLRQGHRWDSERVNASKFPRDWSDQKIVDAVRDVLENPTWFEKKPVARIVWGDVDGVLVRVEYNVLNDGTVVFNKAHPTKAISRKARRRD